MNGLLYKHNIIGMHLKPYLSYNSVSSFAYIIESVDSISRDGPDTPIYVIHYKSLRNSTLINYQDFKLT